jgi:hypothetical protein
LASKVADWAEEERRRAADSLRSPERHWGLGEEIGPEFSDDEGDLEEEEEEEEEDDPEDSDEVRTLKVCSTGFLMVLANAK